jgi:hypothetical protein
MNRFISLSRLNGRAESLPSLSRADRNSRCCVSALRAEIQRMEKGET